MDYKWVQMISGKEISVKCLSGCGYLVSTVSLNSQKWLTCNLSLKYPHIIQQTGYEILKIIKYVEFVILNLHQILRT